MERGRDKRALSADLLEESVKQKMEHTSKEEFARMRWGLGFLASVGSASPFIGLFGTVWGIMGTFQALGEAKSASLAVVAPGISAALIATAAGLAVAIPAVMAYNWFLGQLDGLQEQADCFIEKVLLLIRIAPPASQPLKAEHAGAKAQPATAKVEVATDEMVVPVEAK